MTKAISSVSTWHNGQTVSATKLFLKCIDDDLEDSARFYFEIMTSADEPVGAGNLEMDGSDYASRTGNTYTWNWAADKLGLTLI